MPRPLLHPPLLLTLCLAGCQQDPPQVAGEAATPATRGLQTGAQLLQSNGPAGRLDIHLVGFHPMKDDPQRQMEAHHYCHQLNEDVAHCALFDGDGPEARMNGLEYIISERVFETLPEAERQYWHPHNGEILSGQLSAPMLPLPAEDALMKKKMNSYGKTWHTWHDGQELPLGEPHLAWSFNRDGELDPELQARRDAEASVSTRDRSARRRDLLPLARPQHGVNALRAHFPEARPWPGVVDVTDAEADAVKP